MQVAKLDTPVATYLHTSPSTTYLAPHFDDPGGGNSPPPPNAPTLESCLRGPKQEARMVQLVEPVASNSEVGDSSPHETMRMHASGVEGSIPNPSEGMCAPQVEGGILPADQVKWSMVRIPQHEIEVLEVGS